MWMRKAGPISLLRSASASFSLKNAHSSGPLRPSSIGGGGYFGGEVGIDGGGKGLGNFCLPCGRRQQFLIGFAGEKTEFKQNRRNIRCLQDHEASGAQGLASHQG